MHLAFRRHVDDEVAAEPGLAAEPAPCGQRAALGSSAPRRRSEAVTWSAPKSTPCLAKSPSADLDLAAPADAAPAAHRIEVHAQLARRFQHARALREPPALAGGGEDDEVVGGLGSRSDF